MMRGEERGDFSYNALSRMAPPSLSSSEARLPCGSLFLGGIMIQMKMGKKIIQVEDIASAIATWESYRNKHTIETGDTNIPWPRLIKEGKVFAHISWNGRVWEGTKWTNESKEILA